MSDTSSQTVYLRDYTVPPYLVESVDLTFRLHPTATRVLSKIRFAPNPKSDAQEFRLHGRNLTLISARIDGRPVEPEIDAEGLFLPDPPTHAFTWEAEVEISPKTNTALEGLYMSNGMYCTQCEAEGFRKITYYPDRPDVMAPFRVRIESDLPVLLSNGNKADGGAGWAEWDDPWPKPAYLFALVAGDLVNHPDTFTTASGTEVELNIWVRPGDLEKCAFGMDALKRSMRWDEEVYGREYDLEIFNIVAVDDFNMGAMENKGLNIFNSAAVLASPDTATDANFERIEAIIAHEYFHNWTGNRITCRDWFQLCLKEGLTVFRDQQFTADQRSAAVARIDNVLALRSRQFREDNGPLAHPVRPDSFVEINNFYTATVYEKGAEVIGMLKTLVGDWAYGEALSLYFDRHDGQAITIEDWLAVFEDITGRDLEQFKRWYTDAGTPRLTVEESYQDEAFVLTFTQHTPPTPGQDEKPPRVIPIAVGLLDAEGREVHKTEILEMTEERQSFTFEGYRDNIHDRPIPSILRGFSAPVILERAVSNDTRRFLLTHDTDPFNRWEAGRSLAKDVLSRLITDGIPPDLATLDAFGSVADDAALDPAFRALVLTMPGQEDMAQTLFDAGITPDPQQIWQAGETLRQSLAEHLKDSWTTLYAAMAVDGPYMPDAPGAGHRALRARALANLTRMDGGKLAQSQFDSADNMTEYLAAFAALLSAGAADAATGAFYQKWQDDRLVMDKWFALQIMHALPEDAADLAKSLTDHPDFDIRNPNRFRAVFGALAGNPAGFHHASGAGYDLMAGWLIRLDALNPQTAARMTTAFETWRRYDADRQQMMQAALTRIADTSGLSRNTGEMVQRILS